MFSFRMFKSFLKDTKCFVFFWYCAHTIPVKVHNMAAPAILFCNVISMGLIDWSVSVSHGRPWRVPEKRVWAASLCSFPMKNICNCLHDEFFRNKMLAIVKWEKKLWGFFCISLLSLADILENVMAEWKNGGKRWNTAEGQCEGAEWLQLAGNPKLYPQMNFMPWRVPHSH